MNTHTNCFYALTAVVKSIINVIESNRLLFKLGMLYIVDLNALIWYESTESLDRTKTT